MGKVGGSVAGFFCPELRTSAIEKVVRAAGAEPEVKVARDEFLCHMIFGNDIDVF